MGLPQLEAPRVRVDELGPRDVRTVRRGRLELERHGILRSTIVERGSLLPNGEMARNRTQLLYPRIPGTCDDDEILNQNVDRTQTGSDRTYCVRSDGGVDSFSLDQKLGSSTRCDSGPAELEPSSHRESSRVVFERWREIHDPDLVASDDAIGWLDDNLRSIQGWLVRGVNLQTCLWAVEGAGLSKFNRPPEKRTIRFIFGSLSRITALAEKGREGARHKRVSETVRVAEVARLAPSSDDYFDHEFESRVQARLAAQEEEAAQ
jgi:hypothetical protein